MGRWADRCRGIGHPLPTARDGPQAGRWRRAPQPLDSSTYRPQNQGNKARMSMKTNSRGAEESRSRGVVKPDQEVRRGDAYGLSLSDFQLSTLNCSTRIRRNKARMSMKTKSRGVEESRSRGVVNASQEVKLQDADALSLFDSQLSTSRLEVDGTKPGCL